MAPLSVPLHTSSIILCNLLEYPVLDRVGTPKEGVKGEGDGLLPEPTADVLDPPPTPTMPSANSRIRFSSQSFPGIQSASVKAT